MRYSCNVFVYGKGRSLLSQNYHIVEAISGDEAVELAKADFIGKGDSIVVRGVEPASQKVEAIESAPAKRGRPRG